MAVPQSMRYWFAGIGTVLNRKSVAATTIADLPLALLAPTPDALRRLIGLRYAVAVLLALAVLCVRFVVEIPLPLGPVSACLFALLLVNCALHWQIATRRPVSEQGLFVNFTAE